jgi:AcrR family transcriptional regulator
MVSQQEDMVDLDPGKVTQQQILDASLKVFADNGYDGARMEQIAKQAGVNKSLIYYYFKGKRKIFDILIGSFYDDMLRILEPVLKPDLFEDPATVEHAFENMFRFLESRRDLISILLIETLKKGSGEMTLFKLIDNFFVREINLLDTIFARKEIPPEPESRDQRIVTEFFTLIGPLLLYVVLGQKWSSHFKTGKDDLRKQFINALLSTHVAHHKTELGISGG